jgi:hydroxyethylthiazole kinase-like sugar kinase family protein
MTDAALEVAAARRIPWVLDPVFIDRSRPRADYARSPLARKPGAVRRVGRLTESLVRERAPYQDSHDTRNRGVESLVPLFALAALPAGQRIDD